MLIINIMCANKYCGMGPVPKGRTRGTPKHCLENNQVRYYGIEKINPAIIEDRVTRKKQVDINKEKLKLLSFRNKGKLLVKEYTEQKLIVNHPAYNKSDKKRALAQIELIKKRRDALMKKITDQRKLVNSLNEQSAKKDAKKPVKKDAKKPVKRDAKKPIKRDAKKPVKKDAKKPVKKNVKKPVKK